MRRIQDVESLKRFAKASECHVGVLFPTAYLQRSRVFAFVDRNDGTFHGGFVIVPEPPFRVIESLPKRIKLTHPFFLSVPNHKLCELTAVWLTPEARAKGFSFWLWGRAYLEMLLSGRSHFVYAFSDKKRHLRKVFGAAAPQLIFHGETKKLPGMKAREVEFIEAIRIREMATVPLLKPWFFVRRMGLRRGLKISLAEV